MRTWDFTHSGIRPTLSRLFYQHGLLVAHYPKSLLILLCVAIPVLASPILMWSLFDKLTLSPRYWSSSAQSPASSSGDARVDSSVTSSYFHCILNPDQCNDMPPYWLNGAPALSLQQIVVSFSSYRQPIGNILRNAQKISEHLFSVIDKSFREFNKSSSEYICYQVESSFLDDSIYPEPKCLVLSPIPIILNIFHEKPSKILDPYAPHTLSNDSQLRNPSSSVKELLFGGFWTHWSSILGLGLVDTSDQLTFSLTLFLNTSSQHIQTEQSEFVKILRRNFNFGVKQTEWLHIFYPRDEELVELFPLIFLYSVVFLYISISVSKIEEVKSRVGLACAAILTLFGSVCISVGMCILFGLRATLDGRDVVPFIIVVIGLENILLVTNCVISTPRELDAPLRIAKGLGQQGVAITRSLATQISLLLLAYLTFNPAIQEFCIISILGLLNNFLLLMAFFIPILSIDLKRLELSDMRQTEFIQNSDTNNHRQKDSGKNPIYLKIIHKLEEVRILQKIFTFLLCVLLAWWLLTSRSSLQMLMQEMGIDDAEKLRHTISSMIGTDSTAEDTTMGQVSQEESNPYFQELHENIISDRQYVHDQHYSFTLQPSNDSNIALCGANPCWTELIKYHLPNLFTYYDISLVGEYITLLPPIYLRAVGNREVPPNDVTHVGHAGYLRPPEFGLDFLLMIIGSLFTISLVLSVTNQLVFNLTLHKGMPSNSDLHNANIRYQILGTLYDGSQVIQPLEYVLYNNNNFIATRLRDMRLQLWNISPKQNNFSINQWRQINLAENMHLESSDLELRGTVNGSDSDSSSKGEENSSLIRGYEFPKHFNFLAPHLDSLRSTLPERQKRIPLFDINDPILWCIECCDSWLAAGFQNGLITLWNIHSSQLVLQLQPTSTGVTCIKIIPRPYNVILYGTVDGFIVKIPISNPSLVQKLKISDNMATHIEYAHNRVVVSNFECALRVYRVDRMTELFTLLRHPGYITCICIDNNPLLGCATGCKKGMVCSWDLETGTCVRNFQETQHKIISILTTTSLVISLAMDRMVRMRERRSGEMVKKIQPDSMARSMCLLTENLLVVGCKGCAVLYNLTYDMLEPKVIQLREGKEMDHVSKILKITTSVFACTTRKYIYMLSWGISKKEKTD